MDIEKLKEIETLERKYFEKICDALKNSVLDIEKQLNSINEVKDAWLHIAFRKKTNIVDKFAERITRQELLRKLNWDYLGLPISSDECFMLNDAVVHIDVKTQLATERFDVKNPNEINITKKFEFSNLIASQNQITLPRIDKIPFKKGVNGFIEWEPHLPLYYNFKKEKLPCLTFFIRYVYAPLCPKCGLFQDVAPKSQKEVKDSLNTQTTKHVCAPFGTKTYSIKNTCKTEYEYPSYELEEIVIYCVPHGELAKEFYDCNWFKVGMPYKSPVTEDKKIIGISSGRIILESFTKPTKVPPWWKENWNRTCDIKIKPLKIIDGK